MLNAIDRLDGLLADAVQIAEMTSDRRLLAHLHEAQGSILATRATAAPIRVDVLAGRVFFRGLPVPFTPAELAVIMALAQTEVGLGREALADLLYPDYDITRSANILKVSVHRARKRISVDDFICVNRGRLMLGANVDVDVRRLVRELGFLRARAGPLTEDERQSMERLRIRLADGRPPIMLQWSWFEDTERNLQWAAHDVTVLLAEDALLEREYQRAITLAHALAQLDPLDELAAEVAIRAFLLAGNHTAAVLEYRHYESILGRAAEASPSPRLRALIDGSSAIPHRPIRT